MKSIIHISVLTIACFLLIWAPATGFNLKGQLSKASSKVGIPDPVLDRIGSLMYTIKLKSIDLCKAPDRTKLVKTVWEKLLAAAPQCQAYKNAKAKNWQWQMELVEDNLKADAEAFPGGKVLVYSGVNFVSRDQQDQIAFVLSHEVAHALARDAKSRFDEHTKTALMAAATGAGLNAADVDPKVVVGAMTAIGVAYEGARVVPFSKAQEIEADRNALMIMAQAGYDPEASLRYLNNQKVVGKKKSSKLKMSSMDDHPSLEQREANINRHMAEAVEIYLKNKG